MHLTIFYIYSLLFVLVVNGDDHIDAGSSGNVDGQPAPSNGGTTIPPITSPVLNYTCSTTNVITIISVSSGDYSNIQVLKKKNAGTGFCKKTANTKSGFQTCITENTDAGIVYLLYQQETNLELVAGKQFTYVKLTCDEKMEVKEATFDLSGKFGATGAPDWTTLVPVQNSGDLSLSITPITDLHVGDVLTVKMTIDGAGYTISPQHCEAKRKSDDTTVPIWKCHSLVDANIISEVLWKSVEAQKSVTIQMFAFKFVDTEDVIIQCSANVCPTGTQECKLDACTGQKRKRRDLKNLTTGINIPVEHASVSMKVKDPLLNRSSGLNTIWYAHFVPVFVMISARLYL